MRAGYMVLTAALLLAGCSAGADMKTAEGAVTQFHQRLDAGDYDTIYTQSAPEMMKATTESDLVNLLSAVHRKLGNTSNASQQGVNVNYGTAGEIVTLTYKTQFAAGPATERFSYRVDQGQAKLIGFNIDSPTLILK